MNEIMNKNNDLNQDINSIDELFQRSLRFRDTYESSFLSSNLLAKFCIIPITMQCWFIGKIKM